MKLLSTYLRGKSLTVCFAFPEAYDMANIDDLNVSIGSKQFTGDDIDISGKVACVRLKSEDTYKFTGDYPIIISIDDKTRGVIPIYVGDIRFVTHRNNLNNASTNEQNDIVVSLSITQTTIDVDSVLYDVMKGDKGDAGTIDVGEVTTGDAGTDVFVENVGTSSEAVLNFTIPRGDAGYTPYIGVNGNWFINGVDTGVQAEGDATEAWVAQNYLSKLDFVGEFEPVRDKLAGIEDNANNYVHPGTHPPAIIEQDANNRFVTDAEKSAWNSKQNDLGFTPENAANKKTTLTDSDTDYPTTKAVNAGLAGKQNTIGYTPENTVNKQNSLAVDGTGAKYPTVDAVNAGLALKVAYTDSLKYYPTINYGNRVIADSGVISDLEKLTKLYVENLKLLDNTVFLWDGSAGIKTRTSGANTFATKLYDMSSGNKDAVQATEANQPFVGGGIAPNERMRILGTSNTQFVSFSKITLDNSGFAVSFIVNNKMNTAGLVIEFLRANNGAKGQLRFQDNCVKYVGLDSGGVIPVYDPTFSNKSKNDIVTLIGINGNLSTYRNGVLVKSFTGITQMELEQLYAGNHTHINHVSIFNKALSASEVQAQHAYLRLQYPEIEGINIGNQHWATSNYEGVVTGNGTVIPEVQGASTAANPELVVNGGFDTAASWTVSGGVAITGGAAVVTNAALNSTLNQIIASIRQGVAYQVQFTVSDYVSGAIAVRYPFSTGAVYYSGNGTYTIVGVADQNATALLFQTKNEPATFKIDNVSLKEVGWADLTTPARCYYNNDPLNGAVYGKNYNLYGAQAINSNAPTGYTIGTYAQWLQMVTLLGGTSIAGNKMKLNGTALWAIGNAGTNESGFTALPNGQRNADGSFSQINNKANFWTSDGYLVALDYNAATVTFTSGADAKIGAAVRLLRTSPVGDNERTIETGYIINALGATNLDISIPFGYQVESIRFDSETNITGLSAKLLTGALVELETLFTAKSVTANVQKVIAADADQSIQQTDAVVRINGTKADTTKRFRVWIKLTKVIFS